MSDGGASGPESCPPAYFTSACTRDSTEGWVANRSAKPSRGLSTHNSITAEVAPGSSPRFSILRSAEIMASGFFVSSTDPASASSSRDRDRAGDDDCDHHQLHVAVADVGELVAQHRLDLLVVERLQQARGDGDGILPLIEPGRERVQCLAVHHLEFRHREAP